MFILYHTILDFFSFFLKLSLTYTIIGADLCAGSLIKNLGGTLALTGGYIAGRADLVAAARVHLSAPGVEGGATLNQYRTMYQVSNSIHPPKAHSDRFVMGSKYLPIIVLLVCVYSVY